MTRQPLTARAVALTIVLLLTIAGAAAAQGRGKGGPPTTPGMPGGQGSAAAEKGPIASAGTFRQFGAWLDDATTLAAGSVLTGVSFGYWRTESGNQFDVPIVDVSGGVANRVQLSATVPFYRTDYGAGATYGLDDVYLGAKVMAIDPSSTPGRFGLSIGGIAEIMSPDTVVTSRTHWAVPVSLEAGNDTVRAYGSVGYFSRGAVFTGAAIEVSAATGTSVTGALTQSYSTNAELLADGTALSRQRVDLAGTVSQSFGRASAYVSVGRSLTAPVGSTTTFALTGGIYVRFGE